MRNCTYDLSNPQNCIDYYPFGMPMPGRTFTGSDDYRYGFNGMEGDDEVKGNGNSYDFGARMYDPRVGKFLSLDPMQKEYPSVSDYSFVYNNPMIFVDPTGNTIEPASNLTGDELVRVQTAIQKFSEERPKQYAYIQSLRYHPGQERFISSEDADYESLKESSFPFVVQVTIADTDGKTRSEELKQQRNQNAKTSTLFSNVSDTHINGDIKSGSNFSLMGANGGQALVKTPEGKSIAVPFTSPDQDFGENTPMFKFNVYETSNGEYHALITIDDFSGGNSGTAGDLEVLAHEVGHVEGDIADVKSAAFDQANPQHRGHGMGQSGGEVANDREKNDRPTK